MGLLLVFFTYRFISIDDVARKNVENTEYTNKLTSACYDAAQSMQEKNIEEYGCVWHNEQDIENTLNVFYSSLAYSLNREGAGRSQIDEIALYTPMVVLIDVNGYYVSHNIVFDESGMVEMDPIEKERISSKRGITGLNTWSEDLGGDKKIRYFLNDDVEVYLNTGRVYRGDRFDVYQRMENDNGTDPVPGDLGFIIDQPVGDDRKFNERKNQFITKEINAACDYYLNRHNIIGSYDDLQYSFELPDIPGEQWARMIQNPTVISFLQGYSTTVAGKLINTYALAAGELIKNYHYFITKTTGSEGEIMQYHCFESEQEAGNCEIVTTTRSVKNEITGKEVEETIKEYLYLGEPIDEIYFTQTECAQKGASPHVCVYEWP